MSFIARIRLSDGPLAGAGVEIAAATGKAFMEIPTARRSEQTIYQSTVEKTPLLIGADRAAI
jgi:hypothetical protein